MSFCWTRAASRRLLRSSNERLSSRTPSESAFVLGLHVYLRSTCRAPPANVLALVNKGLALYQYKQDIQAAETCCKEALRIDPDSEAATATLAQLYLQQSKIADAVKLFNRQVDLSRSAPELVNALTYKFVSQFTQPTYSCGANVAGRLRRRNLLSRRTTQTWLR